MLVKLLQTEDDKVLTAARVLLGLLFFVRGAQGLLGWFGGLTWNAPLNSLLHLVGLPLPLVLLAVVTDFGGGTALIAGLLTRVAAAGVAADTVVAFVLWGIGQGLYTDWLIIQGGSGSEFYLLAFALALIVTAKGAGAISLDRVLFRRMLRSTTTRVATLVAGPATSGQDE